MRTSTGQLAALCRAVGDDLLLVQGGGGNGSVKSADGQRMWIKASGVRMADVRPESGHCALDLPQLRAGQPPPQTLPRPSMEWGLHAVLGRAVLHTHPVYVNAFACMAQGREALAEVLGQQAVWLDYCAPGPDLATGLAAVVAKFQQQHDRLPDHVVLANHGLVTSADHVAEALAVTRRLTQAGVQWFGALADDALAQRPPDMQVVSWAEGLQAALARRGMHGWTVRAAHHVALRRAAEEPEHWLGAGPLVPDDVVFGASGAQVIEAGQTATAWLDSRGPFGSCALVALRGLGVVLAGPSEGSVQTMAENLVAHVLVRQLLARRGVAQPLASDAVAAILGMEAEAYRRAVAAGR